MINDLTRHELDAKCERCRIPRLEGPSFAGRLSGRRNGSRRGTWSIRAVGLPGSSLCRSAEKRPIYRQLSRDSGANGSAYCHAKHVRLRCCDHCQLQRRGDKRPAKYGGTTNALPPSGERRREKACQRLFYSTGQWGWARVACTMLYQGNLLA